MKKKEHIDLIEFEIEFDKFLMHPTWTKLKHESKRLFYSYLAKHKTTKIRVKPKSEYNYCTIKHSFTILKVPSNKRGKLFSYINKWVLIRCDSDSNGSWSYYWNEVYNLKNEIEADKLQSLKLKYKKYFVSIK